MIVLQLGFFLIMNEKIDKKLQDKSSFLLSTHYSGSPTKKNETTRANRVAFKNSNPASLDLEQNHPDRCMFM